MLDHDHGVALVAQFEEQIHQLLDIHPVQARRRLIEDVERRALLAFTQLERELDALGLSAGQRRGRLTEREIAEPDRIKCREFVHHPWNIPKEDDRFAHRHIEHVRDRFSVKQNFERLAIVATPRAARTRRIRIGHELHVELDGAITLTTFAPTAPHVERKPARLVAAHLGERHLRVEVPQQRKQIHIRRGIRTRTPPDRLLVDLHQLLEEIEVLDVPVFAGNGFRAVQFARRRRRQHIVHQRALAGAAHPGDTRQQSHGKFRVDAAEIVRPRLAHREPRTIGHLGLSLARDGQLPRKIGARARLLDRERGTSGRRALKQETPSFDARFRPQLNDLIRQPHRVFVVFDHEHRVPPVAQRHERIEELLVVVRMQADARFIEHVDHANEPHPKLRREPHPLRLPTRQRGVIAIERQVTETRFEEKVQALLDPRDDITHGVVRPVCRDQLAGKRIRFADVELHEFRKRFSAAPHRAAPGIEPRAVTLRTFTGDHEGRKSRLKTLAVRVPPAVLQIGDHPGKRLRFRLAHAPQLDRKLPFARPK